MNTLFIGLTIYCNKWNTVTLSTDGSALKELNAENLPQGYTELNHKEDKL